MADPQSIAPTVEGDPVIALTAQINRFRKAANQTQYALTPGVPVTAEIAIQAITLLQTRAIAAIIQDPNAGDVVHELTVALKQPIQYVAPRVTSITQQLALYGDSTGLPPAPVGITKVDTSFHPRWDFWMYASVIGSLGILAAVASAAAKRLSRRTSKPAAPAA